MRERKLRAGVIGLGAMGRHHVRIYNELPGVELVSVADVDAAAVDRTIGQYPGMAGYTDLDMMLEKERLDLVSIAVPTALHHQVVLKSLDSGVNVLVEKPIASTVPQAREMIEAAQRVDVRFMVGHIERFNPAILELKRRINQVGTIFQVSARRVGPFPDRIQDVGVVVDLASHDIDTMNFILESHIQTVYAQTTRRIHASHEDMVLGTLRFADGTIGSLDVNWLTATKIRQLTVVGSRGTFVADYLSQDLAFFENGSISSEWSDLDDLQKISEGHAIRYAFPKSEPLKAELEGFVDSVRYEHEVPSSPFNAANSLAIALDLLESARIGSPVSPTLLE